MSKAFTREVDEIARPELKPISSLLSGGKNYMTSQGLRELHDKLSRLMIEPVSDTSRQEIYELRQHIQSAVVPAPPPLPWGKVYFGAVVTVRNGNGEQTAYRLVGVNETDPGRNHISWRSPIARALLKAKIGDHVRFQTPDGEQHLEITGVS